MLIERSEFTTDYLQIEQFDSIETCPWRRTKSDLRKKKTSQTSHPLMKCHWASTTTTPYKVGESRQRKQSILINVRKRT